MSPIGSLRLRLRIALARHRRLVVALLLALAVASALQSLRPPGQPTQRIAVAARDLPAGHRLSAGDLEICRWPAGSLPAGLVTQPDGRVLAAPLRRGEPVTDVRVTSGRPGDPVGSLPSGWTAMTVRLGDPAAALLVAPGDRVQVIAGGFLDPLGAGPPATSPAQVIVQEAVVLAMPVAPTSDLTSFPEGGGLLGSLGGGTGTAASEATAGVVALAVDGDDALKLAAAIGTRALTLARQLSMSS